MARIHKNWFFLRPAFEPVEANDLLALKNHRDEDKTDMVRPALVRLPSQPDWLQEHPAMKEHRNKEKPGPFTQDVNATEFAYWRRKLDVARSDEMERRWLHRRLEEDDAAWEHALRWVLGEDRRRAAFFQRVMAGALAQRKMLQQASQRDIEAFAMQRQLMYERAIALLEQSREQRAEKLRQSEEYLRMRQESLFTETGTGGIRRLRAHGQPAEAVFGRIYDKETDAIAAEFLEWHRSNLWAQLPNGGMARTDNGSGKSVEFVTDQLAQPVRDHREQTNLVWRQSNSMIVTPNDGLVHLQNQGRQPEAMFARRAQPLKEAITAQFRERREGNRTIITVNDTIAHQPVTGDPPGKTTADLRWSGRSEQTAWHGDRFDHQLLTVTENGAVAPLVGIGDEPEKALNDIKQPTAEARTEFFVRREAHQKYVITGNGAVGHQDGRGEESEAVRGDLRAEDSRIITAEFRDAKLRDLYTPTANHTWRRLINIGRGLEDVAADVSAAERPVTPGLDKQSPAQTDAEVSVRGPEQLPQKGPELAEARQAVAARSHRQRNLDLAEIRKNLAAHEASVSRLQDHVTQQQALADLNALANTPENQAATERVQEPQPSLKTGKA